LEPVTVYYGSLSNKYYSTSSTDNPISGTYYALSGNEYYNLDSTYRDPSAQHSGDFGSDLLIPSANSGQLNVVSRIELQGNVFKYTINNGTMTNSVMAMTASAINNVTVGSGNNDSTASAETLFVAYENTTVNNIYGFMALNGIIRVAPSNDVSCRLKYTAKTLQQAFQV
jgi:hypothetical protein